MKSAWRKSVRDWGWAMPLFEFRCKCGHEWDDFVKMGEIVQRCPVCGEKTKKNIGTVGFRADHTVSEP